MPSTTLLDAHWMGRTRAIAVALLESDGHLALLDPGPGSTLENIRAQLQEKNLSIADLDAILLTHIHLDHAGATGALVRENPRLAVYVHERGAPHMADPSILLASAGRLWAEELPRLFGEILPVPQENLRVLRGGETLSLGSSKLDVAYTPGHASHHVSFFDHQEGLGFTGDTAGIRIQNGPYIMPAAPPPDIDLELWDKSFEAILERRPQRLFLTHFGFAENPPQHIADFRERLHRWASITGKILISSGDDDAALQSFLMETRAEMDRYLAHDDAEQHAFAAGLPLSFLGLARYLRKRAGIPIAKK